MIQGVSLSKKVYQTPQHCTVVYIIKKDFTGLKSCHSGNYFVFPCDNHKVAEICSRIMKG